MVDALAQGCMIVWTRVREVALLDYTAVLSHDEVARASRIRSSEARYEFMVARNIVRTIAGGVLDCSGAEVDIVIGPKGKPAFGPRHQTDLTFNISHSAGYVAVAFAYGVDLGLDIELSGSTMHRLARHFLTTEENSRILTILPAERDPVLLRTWCAKEALLKAAGVGFTLDPRCIEVLQGIDPFRLGPVTLRDKVWYLEEKELGDQVYVVIAWSTA
ncbi:MAG: 4'-phosphopantetheinyl transferase superfamily protein [Pseudomonadota bacterium]